MSFLAPLFFAALATLAIPVLIHLIQREKKQIQQFPSLMFVRRVPYKSVQRRRIHNWLLLMVRLAALLLIIAAFSRPFFQRASATSAAGAGAREVVVLLDQSYSMGYGDRWERARTAAREALGRLGSSDRASVVLFSSGAEIAIRSTAERSRLLAAIPTTPPSAGVTRYAPALKVAGSILAESPLPRREAILISDFQRGGWRGEEGARLPRGTTFTPVTIGGQIDTPNVTVTSVSLARSTLSNQERVTVTAAIANRSDHPFGAGTLTLDVGGRAIQTERLDVPAHGSASVMFMPLSVTARMRGTVRASADALPIDNAFHFVVSPSVPVRVLLVDRSPAGGASGLYLTRALSIGDMPRFETTVRAPDAISDDDLRRSAVVLMNDVAVPAGLARRLVQYVEGGGGLLIAAGPRASWPGEVDLLPAAIGGVVDRTRGDAGRVGALEYGHPVLELFRAPRSGDFSSARFYGFRSLTPGPAVGVLARFDNGGPALLERKAGDGRVLVWASTLDLSWSDLPLKPVFLPFVHRALRYLAVYTEPAPWLTVGQVLDPASAGGRSGAVAARLALTPSGKQVPLDDEGAAVLELAEQGFYEVRSQSSKTEANAIVVAANVDAAESDLTSMDPKEIAAAMTGATGSGGGQAGVEVPLTPEAQEGAQRIWWYLLVIGIVVLGVDTLLSNRLSKA